MTTLDPRGLEAASEVFGDSIGCPEITERAGVCHGCERRAEQIITAYLAVTQPVVETVEELEGLEVGAVVVDKHGPLEADVSYRGKRIWYYTGNEMPCTSADVALPARVIWRPHESP